MLELDRHVGQVVLLGLSTVAEPLLSIKLEKVTPGAGVTLMFERSSGTEAVTLKLRTAHAFKVGRHGCKVYLLRMDRAQLRLGFDCPKAVQIERQERLQQPGG